MLWASALMFILEADLRAGDVTKVHPLLPANSANFKASSPLPNVQSKASVQEAKKQVTTEAVIPTLPCGRWDVLEGLYQSCVHYNISSNQLVLFQLNQLRQLVFNCVSTRGDKDFVGLAGV